jgi:S4 domain protein YaaA
MAVKTIILRGDEEYMTLQSLLKLTNVISTGGMAKMYLQDNVVLVNGEAENSRGRKLYRGDKIDVANTVFVIK